MKNKINNYVQLVHALTGQEVFMPVDDEEYSFVSVSSGEEEYEEEVMEEESEYVEAESMSVEADDYLLESVRSEASSKDLKIENIALLKDIPEAPSSLPVDNAPPPTPSQIIRKLKATLVQTTMCQIRNTKQRSATKKAGDNNWSYDLARRRLDRELRRIQTRRAYRDAVERLPALTQTIQDEKKSDLESSLPDSNTTPQEASLSEKLAENDEKVVRDAASKSSELQRQLSRRGSLSGSVFAGLLHNLERLPPGSRVSGSTASSQRESLTPKSRKKYRSDQRLQAILNKHHKHLKQEKARLQTINVRETDDSQSELSPNSPKKATLKTITSQSELPPLSP